MKPNPWRILGVNPKTTPEELKAAYRKLAAIHHPDRGGDKDKFAEIQEAYDLLSDPTKRKEYENKSNEKPVTKLKETVHEVVDDFWNTIAPKEAS